MLKHGKVTLIALNVEKVMRIYWDKLHKLNRIIEEMFGEVLADWDGDLSRFVPLQSLINREFT